MLGRRARAWRERRRRLDDRVLSTPTVQARVASAVEDGVLIAKSALSLAVKNHIVVGALREDRSFDAERIGEFVVATLAGLAREQQVYARRTGAEAAHARVTRGRASHAHDYREVDYQALRQRQLVYSTLAEQLTGFGADPEFVRSVVETARLSAWAEIGRVIETHLVLIGGAGSSDDYAERLVDRKFALAVDIAQAARTFRESREGY